MRYRPVFSIHELGSAAPLKLTRPLPISIFSEEQDALRTTQRLLGRPSFRQHSSRKELVEKTNGLSNTAEPSKKDWKLFKDQVDIPNENIYFHDLEATIRAHQDFNARPKVRKIWSQVGGGHSVQRSAEERNVRSELKQKRIRHDIQKQIRVPKASQSLEKPENHWPRGSPQYMKLTGDKVPPPKEEVCEYKPRIFEPDGSFHLGELREDADSPWRSLIMLHGGDGHARLAAEILAFERYMKLDIAERKAAAVIRHQIAKYVRKANHGARIQLIGSYSTGLGTPLSDMDFTVILPQFEKNPLQRGPSSARPEARKARTRAMMRFKSILDRQDQEWRDVEVVWASIPLIIGTHRKSRITVQLQQQKGSLSAFLDFTAFNAFQSEFPTLRPLYILLKTALAVRGLDKTIAGGLSSYPLLIAIVNALKHCEHKYHREDLANHLLFILRFYVKSDLYNAGFRLDHPRLFPKLGRAASPLDSTGQPEKYAFEGMAKIASPNPQQPYLLCLQDPLNPNNDLGKKAYAIKHIRALFRVALEKIKSSMKQWEIMGPDERKQPKDLILDVLIKANYEAMEVDRAKRRRFAERMAQPSDDRHMGQY